MTGILPYDNYKRDVKVTDAIKNFESPCTLSNLEVPPVVRYILGKCWKRGPQDRPSSAECQMVLGSKSLSGFFTEIPYSDFPSQYKAQGDSWRLIRNPDFSRLYRYNIGTDFNPEASYVRKPLSNCQLTDFLPAHIFQSLCILPGWT